MRAPFQAHRDPLVRQERPVELAGLPGGVEGHPVAARAVQAARAQEVLGLGRRGEPGRARTSRRVGPRRPSRARPTRRARARGPRACGGRCGRRAGAAGRIPCRAPPCGAPARSRSGFHSRALGPQEAHGRPGEEQQARLEVELRGGVPALSAHEPVHVLRRQGHGHAVRDGEGTRARSASP